LIEAWKYTSSDLLLHVLPLHHIHGMVNALFTPLLAGSSIEFLYPFSADSVWKRLAAPFSEDRPANQKAITFFTAVPTIWTRLLDAHSDLDEPIRTASREAISPQNLRLNISGSAALPTPTKKAWSELSGGNILLERYGMTEVGMALSCGLDSADRVDGSVGWPLPFVQARLVDTETGIVIATGEESDSNGRPRDGEIQLRGPTVFKEYWRNPKATSEGFVEGNDGKGKWFKTGDIAMRQDFQGAGKSDQDWAKGPLYFIKGRASADIIKTGGEKVSALEIERELLALPQIAEATVVGVPSEKWGQKVTAVCVLKKGEELSPLNMRRALKERLVGYKVPQALKVVESIPRNAMGKSECFETLQILVTD
jgi:malonyl-CoA/methylmalonyl-CoA synthetase